MSTYSDVKAQIAKLEKQAADLFKKEVASVITKIRTLIKEYGLTAADLGLTGKAIRVTKTKTSAKPAGVPKYRDPVSGKTWTGHGKAPAFITEAVKKGKSRDDFLITKKAPAKKVAKATKPAKKVGAKKSPAAKKPTKASVSRAPAKKPKTKAAVAAAAEA
jgi:DNA-binding protein H-NS